MKLKNFRVRHRLTTKDVVGELSKTYPNYTKGINSIAEHPEKYGLQLEPKAVKALKTRFAPVRSETSSAVLSDLKKRASPRAGKSVKLGTAALEELNFLMRRTGTETERAMLEKIINEACERTGKDGAQI